MKSKGTQLALGAASLLAANLPLVAAQANAAPASQDKKVEALNAASLKSMESTWLKVPHSCKDRTFHADAAPQASQNPRPAAQAIYASFEV